MRPTIAGLHVLCALITFVGTACSEPEPTLDLLENANARTRSRRDRMNVRVEGVRITGLPDGGIPNDAGIVGVTPEAFAAVVATDCLQRFTVSPLDDCTWGASQSSCADSVCLANLNLCVANRLLEIADTVTPIVLDQGSTTITVRPQSAETNAGLREQALDAASEAVIIAAVELKSMVTNSAAECGNSDETTAIGAMTYAESLATNLVEGMGVAHEAALGAMHDNVAVAESDLSSMPNRGEAMMEAWAFPDLSYGNAAQLVFGGRDHGSGAEDALRPWLTAALGSGSEAPAGCTTEPPTGGALGALQGLRMAGIRPADITDTDYVDVNDLVTGSRQSPDAGGAVAWRTLIAEQTNTSAIGSMGTDQFLATMGVSRADVVSARRQFGGEMHAFARSSTATLPGNVLAENEPGVPRTGSARYAATALPPSAPPSGYLRAQANFRDLPDLADTLDRASAAGATNPEIIPTDAYADRGLAQLIDYAATAAFAIVDAGPTTLDSSGFRPIAVYAATAMQQRPRRADFAYGRSSSTHRVAARVYSYSATEVFTLVYGVDALRCWTQGNIEGAACDDTSHPLHNFGSAGGTSAVEGFPSVYVYGPADATSDLQANADAYVLRRTGSYVVPGGYEEVASFRYTLRSDTPMSLTYYYSALVPEVPELDAIAERAVTPSTRDCAMPADDCAGLPLDHRLPLEDELTDNGDDIENSWRHYLELARQSAAEADLLADEVISSRIENDMRREAAEAELEDLCGTAINVDGLVDDGLTMAHMAAGMGCPDGYAQIGSQCVADLVDTARARADEDPDAQRLADCLGDDTQYDFVSLSDTPVCVWKSVDNPNIVCARDDDSAACPYLATCVGEGGERDCGCGDPVRPDDNTVVETHPLSFFAAVPGTGGDGPPPCNELRRLRHDATTDPAAVLTEINRGGFFNLPHVRQIAQQIGWEARYLDFSAVTFNGTPWLSTGTTESGPNNTSWPCRNRDPMNEVDDMFDCESVPAGLFCASAGANCDNQTNRAKFNDRLARAVVALRTTTGSGMRGLRMPYLPFTPTGGGLDSITTLTTYQGDLLQRASGSSYNDAGYPVGTNTFHARDGNEAGCIDAPIAPVMWTWVARDGTTTEHTSICGSALYTAMTIFEYGSNLGGTQPGIASGHIWSGMGQSNVVTSPWGHIADWLAGRERISEPISPLTPTMRPHDPRFPHPEEEQLSWYWFQSVVVGPLPVVRPDGLDPDLISARGVQSNAVLPARDGLTYGNVLDGVELACEAARSPYVPQCNLGHPPSVDTANDIPAAQAYISCVAAEMERRSLLTVFANVPTLAADNTGSVAGVGTSPRLGGRYGQAVANMQAGLFEVQGAIHQLGSQFRALSADLDILRIALLRTEIAQESEVLRFQSTIANQMAACASTVMSFSDAVAPIQGAMICANAFAQIHISTELTALAHEDIALASDADIARFQEQFNDRATTLEGIATSISAGQARLNAAISELESIRAAGSRALGRAAFLDSDAAGRSFDVNRDLRTRYNTRVSRYHTALHNAKLMAALAKRAIEQRLGMRLADLTSDMSLVEAPARWQGSLCTMSGVDRAGRSTDDGSSSGGAEDYANGYIGDYVRKLELVVESYRLDYPFHEGRDTAVVSIRDDIKNARAVCAVPGPNLLFHSDDLSALTDEGIGGWLDVDCATPPEGQEVRTCVTATLLPDAPFPVLQPDFRDHRAFRITFGTDADDYLVWRDQSGANHNFWQTTTANMPALSGGGLDFDAVNDFLSGGTTVFAAGAWTVAFDYKIDSAVTSPAVYTLLTFRQSDTTMAWFALFYDGAFYQPLTFSAKLGASQIPVGAAGTWNSDTTRQRFIASYNNGTPTASGSYTLLRNGTTATVNAGNGSAGFSDDAAGLGGINRPTPVSFLDGKIYEVVVFARDLGSTERDRLDDWIENHTPGNEPSTIADLALWLRPGLGQESANPMTTADTARVQRLSLSPGRYRLSWYGRAVNIAGDGPIDPEEAVVARSDVGGLVVMDGAVQSIPAEGEWDRYFQIFDVTGAGGDVEVAIPIGQNEDFRQVDLAGLMLERVTDVVRGTPYVPGADAGTISQFEFEPSEYPPAEYFETTDVVTRDLAVCEDTTGERFRAEHWHRGCLRLCAEGYARDCTTVGPDSTEIPIGTLQCYWETNFEITQADIDRGTTFAAGGFAHGNFNYRFDTLGVNFPGTGARACETSSLPSSCYAAAYIPYTLIHEGPFLVRNHTGQDYDAPLFTGRIEHGRGLAAERKLTNPVSSADRAMLEDYMRREFRGRPLAGRYTLRVWDAPGVDFDRIEDVEILLNYRYWTRFE